MYPKYLPSIYVLPEDGPSWPKYVGEIIMTKKYKINFDMYV